MRGIDQYPARLSGGLQSPTEINAPRGCAGIQFGRCQLALTWIPRQFSRARIESSSRNPRDFNHEIRAQSDVRLHREYNLAIKNNSLRRIAAAWLGMRCVLRAHGKDAAALLIPREAGKEFRSGIIAAYADMNLALSPGKRGLKQWISVEIHIRKTIKPCIPRRSFCGDIFSRIFLHQPSISQSGSDR